MRKNDSGISKPKARKGPKQAKLPKGRKPIKPRKGK